MAPSPLKSADVVGIVRQVLQSEPPDVVGELLHGRGRFLMTFLTGLRVEIADAVYRSRVLSLLQMMFVRLSGLEQLRPVLPLGVVLLLMWQWVELGTVGSLRPSWTCGRGTQLTGSSSWRTPNA